MTTERCCECHVGYLQKGRCLASFLCLFDVTPRIRGISHQHTMPPACSPTLFQNQMLPSRPCGSFHPFPLIAHLLYRSAANRATVPTPKGGGSGLNPTRYPLPCFG